MRLLQRRLSRALVGVVLAGAWMAGAAAYVDRAYACSEMANGVDRPSCCIGGGKTRLTREGGDCCKDVRWDAAASATVRAPEPPAAAQWAAIPMSALLDLAAATDAARTEEHLWARAGPERPPPLAAQLDTTVLLI